MFLDIAKEEKTHVGEFQRLLLNRDKQQVEELEKGKEEVKSVIARDEKLKNQLIKQILTKKQ